MLRVGGTRSASRLGITGRGDRAKLTPQLEQEHPLQEPEQEQVEQLL